MTYFYSLLYIYFILLETNHQKRLVAGDLLYMHPMKELECITKRKKDFISVTCLRTLLFPTPPTMFSVVRCIKMKCFKQRL